jgi:HSP20 family protein
MMNLPNRNRFLSGFGNSDYLHDYLAGREDRFTPSVNIAENDQRYKIEMGLPGFRKDDFKIDLEKDNLTIHGEMEKNRNHIREEYTRQEFDMESFEKSFQLPDNVDEEHITAKYIDGLLEIELPKKKNLEHRHRKVKIS